MITTRASYLNTEFRDFAASSRYPFFDTSTYRADDGRVIPLGSFLDILLYPRSGTIEDFYLISIFRDGTDVLLKFQGAVTLTEVSAYIRTGSSFLYDRYGDVSGSIVYTDEDTAYVSKLATERRLTFSMNQMRVHPSRVLNLPVRNKKLFVEDEEVINLSTPVTLDLSEGEQGSRFSGAVLDTSISVVSDVASLTSIKTINDVSFKNNNAWLFSAYDCNLRIITEDDTLYFYRKGDPIDEL